MTRSQVDLSRAPSAMEQRFAPRNPELRGTSAETRPARHDPASPTAGRVLSSEPAAAPSHAAVAARPAQSPVAGRAIGSERFERVAVIFVNPDGTRSVLYRYVDMNDCRTVAEVQGRPWAVRGPHSAVIPPVGAA